MIDKCLIISGGDLYASPYYLELAAQANCVICADGGAKAAVKIGITPDIIVGDFDTLTEEETEEFIRQGRKIIRYPKEKDYTDTHLCLLEAFKEGYTDIEIIGALGGRLDHSIANIMLLALPNLSDIKMRISDEEQEVFLVRDRVAFQGEIGAIVSLFPFSDQVKGITTKGLKYFLKTGKFIMGIPMGISNEIIDNPVEISIDEGSILVIKYKKRP